MIDLDTVRLEYPIQTIPWLELKLSDDVIKHLWKMVKKGEENYKSAKKYLVGNISNSFDIQDEDNYLTTEVLMPLCNYYENKAPNTTKHLLDVSAAVDENEKFIYPCANRLFLDTFWANYQYKHEFNPTHDHSGAFSFVIWMKIPYDSAEQRKEKFLDGTSEKDKRSGTFYFEFINMFGGITESAFPMNPSMEGTMLFFPSKLRHGVHPFYSCDEKRVSISGNLKYIFKYCKA
tara:strand:+ start:198 stop:896 length:699 start_codon:yes stop_codon:yes gene_type:complete